MHERFAYTWQRLRERRIYQACLLVAVVSISLWLGLGWGRQWFYVSHFVTWTLIIETARYAEEDRRWAQHARPLEWHLNPKLVAVYLLGAALLVITGLTAVGHLTD